ncbi:MAG: hypothetical protein ABI581_08470 [Sediminibacterium sp.]
MRKMLCRITLSLATILPGIFAISQNLTPQELIQINRNPDSVISNTLTDKGFKKDKTTGYYVRAKETISSCWYFQPFPSSGEKLSSFLIKTVDSNQKAKTVFLLYNPFNYKEFVQNLVKSKYRFTGIQIVGSKAYTVFENKQAVFMTTERERGKDEPVFEIIAKAK